MVRNVTCTNGGCRQPLWRRWVGRVVLALTLALALAYLPYQLLDGAGIRRIPKLERELADTRRDIAELRSENHLHRQQINALKNDPAAIEDIARDELGMVRPGEIVIRVDRVANAQPEERQ